MPTTVLAAKTVVAAGVLALAATGTAAAFATPTSRPDHATARVTAAHDLGTTHASATATDHRPSAAATRKDTSRGTSARGEASPTTSHEETGASTVSARPFGLCTAFTRGGLDSHSTAYAALVTAAGGAASIHGYCAGILHPGHAGGVHPEPATARPTDRAHKS